MYKAYHERLTARCLKTCVVVCGRGGGSARGHRGCWTPRQDYTFLSRSVRLGWRGIAGGARGRTVLTASSPQPQQVSSLVGVAGSGGHPHALHRDSGVPATPETAAPTLPFRAEPQGRSVACQAPGRCVPGPIVLTPPPRPRNNTRPQNLHIGSGLSGAARPWCRGFRSGRSYHFMGGMWAAERTRPQGGRAGGHWTHNKHTATPMFPSSFPLSPSLCVSPVVSNLTLTHTHTHTLQHTISFFPFFPNVFPLAFILSSLHTCATQTSVTLCSQCVHSHTRFLRAHT